MDVASLDEEVRLVSSVLRHPAGLDLSVMALLSVRTTEQATVEVEWTQGGRETSRSFPLAALEDAARLFCALRREMRLGADFEVG